MLIDETETLLEGRLEVEGHSGLERTKIKTCSYPRSDKASVYECHRKVNRLSGGPVPTLTSIRCAYEHTGSRPALKQTRLT